MHDPAAACHVTYGTVAFGRGPVALRTNVRTGPSRSVTASDQALDRARVGDIRPEGRGRSAGLQDARHDAPGCLGRCCVADGHCMSVGGQSLRDRSSEAT